MTTETRSGGDDELIKTGSVHSFRVSSGSCWPSTWDFGAAKSDIFAVKLSAPLLWTSARVMFYEGRE